MYFLRRLLRKINKIRLTPIRVFCFHDVSDSFNPDTTWECDWIQTDLFKERVTKLSKEYRFISLSEAYKHISRDIIRTKKYCVLTCDDGVSSFKQIVPWIAGKGFPITIFVNSAILKGIDKREKPMELLSVDDIHLLVREYPSLLTIGNHGYRHLESSRIPMDLFIDNVMNSEEYLSKEFVNTIPFFAYPSDKHNSTTDRFLISKGIIPVYCDGGMNYGDSSVIHRELL